MKKKKSQNSTTKVRSLYAKGEKKSLLCAKEPRSEELAFITCNSPNSVSAKKTEGSCYHDCSKEFFL